MGLLRSRLGIIGVIVSLWAVGGCGGHKPAGASPFPAKITISPTTSASLQAGSFIIFTATAQNSSNGSISTTFTYQSSDTSILNLTPTGVACAGHWDITDTICTPGAIGVAQVTATALGQTSPPTYVFVHPPIDNVQVNGILLNNVPIQEPCLSSGQTMTVEAHAFSNGTDITSSVGPFTWSANNASVVKITPLVNSAGSPAYPFATNQATVAAVTPGLTEIYATASGATSTTFYQPQYQNSDGATSPLLDFFETCPIQNIALEVGPAGSQLSNQTNFVTAKGASENVTAVITDVMGNNSLPQANTTVTLSKIPLTWTSSQSVVLSPANGCTESCAIGTPSVGSGTVTASCTPPTCNIGFPEIPVALSTPANLASCASFFKFSCEPFIPLPVYSSPPCSTQAGAQIPCATGQPPVTAAVTGLVTGLTAATSALVSSVNCAPVNPLDCSVGMFNVSTNRSVAGNATPLPNPPNSLLFDLGGDKAYVGSEIAAFAVNPANVGTGSSPFTAIGAVTGTVLAVSNNGSFAIYSNPSFNEVFVVNATASSAPTVTTLNIANATVAGFSPDNLRAYIYGFNPNGSPIPNLYVYSTLQAPQTIPLPAGTTVNAITFSTNGAFAYIVEPSLAGGGPAVTVYNNCVHDVTSPSLVADTFTLTAPPVVFEPMQDGTHFVALENNGTFDYITATITGPTIATVSSPAVASCPMTVSHSAVPLQNINLHVGNIQGLNIFSSADGSLIYVLAGNIRSVLVYEFATGGTSGIQLIGNAAPLAGFISPDGGTIVITGSDDQLHVVKTAAGGVDTDPPIPFPNLPNYLNPFCTFPPANCTPNLMALRP